MYSLYIPNYLYIMPLFSKMLSNHLQRVSDFIGDILKVINVKDIKLSIKSSACTYISTYLCM